jgi:lipoic acid synthetase
MSELLQIEGTAEAAKSARKAKPRIERPDWLRVRYRQTPQLDGLLALVREERLNTVCQSAACPNLGECWSHGTATFMIGGNLCTRACGFCDVKTGRPDALDPDEPARVGAAVAKLRLRFAVVTAVARDDLDDGGASHFARTIDAIRTHAPGCKVEVLIPDLKGSVEALGVVLAASPDVLNHNLETVERLQKPVRKAGRYTRSLEVLANAARLRPEIPTKTGLMLGLGETEGEIRTTLADIRAHGCRLLTIGQYLAPSTEHLPIARWVTPAEFDAWADEARALGFDEVFSGPLVRSSYRAEKLAGF